MPNHGHLLIYANGADKEICSIIGHLTLIKISQLESIGLKLIESREQYKNILEAFLEKSSIIKTIMINIKKSRLLVGFFDDAWCGQALKFKTKIET